MIIGVGSDIVDIRRIEKSLKRFGERFEKRIFTETERKKAQSRKGAGLKVIAGTYAKRFAAKEALSKALGTGVRMGVNWREMEVINLPTGQPTLRVSGAAESRLKELTPSGHEPCLHLSMTDEYPYAQATVMLEAIKL
jgi:holo-[acyl-carrier protein] synthase